MNTTSSIPIPLLVVYVLWGVVAGCGLVALHGWATHDIAQTQLGGFLGALMVGPATVAHVRLYAARVCAVVRAVQGSAEDRVPLRQL